MLDPVHWVDHALVALFFVVYPLAGLAGFRRLLRRRELGRSVDRKRIYRNTVLGHWLLLLPALAWWHLAGRSWSSLGLSATADRRALVGAAFVAAGIAVLVKQLRAVARSDAADVARLHERFGHLAIVVPRTPGELRAFYGVSVTAGIVEELLWRGFLIWYLTRFWPPALAALVATLAFGLAHAWQGWRQVPAITGVGAALTALYLLTGSLWASILLHTAIDALQGRLAFEVGRRHAAMP